MFFSNPAIAMLIPIFFKNREKIYFRKGRPGNLWWKEEWGSLQVKEVCVKQKKNAMEIILHRIPKYKPL